jgi:cell division transport system ATP-binding protein
MPKLLVADEPTGNIDDDLAVRLLRLFEELNRVGTTIVIATHNEALVARFGHQRLHLAAGELQTERLPRAGAA